VNATTTTATATAGPTHRKFFTQLRRAIATAIALSIDRDSFIAEATVAYGESGGGDDAPPPPLVVHADGYHDVPGCPHPCVTPIPMLLGMELTQHQIDVIRTNCGLNPAGDWLDSEGNPIPGAGLGFEGPTGGVPAAISWKAATNFERDPADPERVKKGSVVPFVPRVVRIRARTLAEASAAWAANPF
jgi:hypothetical protein